MIILHVDAKTFLLAETTVRWGTRKREELAVPWYQEQSNKKKIPRRGYSLLLLNVFINTWSCSRCLVTITVS